MNQTEVCQKAVNIFGERAQVVKAIEELAELQQSLCKWLLGGSYLGVVEEMADVAIMMAQLELIFGSTAVDKEIARKIERLAVILDQEEASRKEPVAGAI